MSEFKRIRVPRYVEVPEYEASKTKPQPRRPFAETSDRELLSYGVPAEQLADVHLVTEDSLLDYYGRLPAEAGEALLELATGGKPPVPKVSAPASLAPANPFLHPDAQRRFRVVKNVDELRLALDFPWDRWTIFLHPDQRAWIEKGFNGPARVSGSAGTGKTVVALHRAVALAHKHPDARVLLTTFSHVLANSLRTGLRRLLSGEPRVAERLAVHSIGAVGLRLYKAHIGELRLAGRAQIVDAIRAAAKEAGSKLSMTFIISEWEQVVDAWQLDSWEAYRDVARLGRKTRLPESQRLALWGIFEKVRETLTSQKLITDSEMFTRLAAKLEESEHPPYDFLVVDEAQDLSVAQLRMLAAIGKRRPDGLFFTGDLGQRIFQQPFSWLGLGVDVRGRSRTLRVNYRTSHQIRVQADRLLDPQVSDADGNVEERRGTVSVFNGPPPEIQTFPDAEAESAAVGNWLQARVADGVLPHELAVFVRSDAQLPRALAAVRAANMPFKILDENVETTSGHISVSTMELAKGLEFRAVAVMACDDEVVPLQERIESVGDETDLQEIYETERHLLYVACTRARDQLLVSGIQPASEFIDDMAK